MTEALHDAGQDVAAGTMAREVLRGQLAACTSLLPAVLQGADAEALHDLRVAMRRSRTVLAQLADVLPGEHAARLRTELVWLARLSGPVRDLDVYLEMLPRHAHSLNAGLRAALEPLRDFALRRRAVAFAALAAGIDSPRAAALIDAWRRLAFGAGSAAHGAAAAPAASVGAKRIAHRYRRLLERGARIDRPAPAAELHALRKSAKKLRYLIDLFAEVLPGEDAGRLAGRLRRLQDVLGHHHDAHVHAALTLQLAEQLAAAGAAAPRTLLAAGAAAQAMHADEQHSVGPCLRALGRLGRPKVRHGVARLAAGSGER